MIPDGELTGVVLAGGQSTRMGRDKATLPCAMQLLWQRQLAVLRQSGAVALAMVRQPGQAALALPPDCRLWHDRVTDAGPIAGLQVALASSRTSLLAVLAVDMPAIDPWWFQWLGSFCDAGTGAVARRPDGRYEPLAAIYPRAAAAEATGRMAGADKSLQSLAVRLIEQQLLRSVPLPEKDLWRVSSWNSPADAAAGTGRLATGRAER